MTGDRIDGEGGERDEDSGHVEESDVERTQVGRVQHFGDLFPAVRCMDGDMDDIMDGIRDGIRNGWRDEWVDWSG